jgi:hypothetical protein
MMDRVCAWTQRRLVLSVLGLIGALCFVPLAHAHPELERGKQLANELDLEQAVAAFDSAAASGPLTRMELFELLDERVLLLYALKRNAALEADLTWLSALDSQHALDSRAPPELQALWRSIRDRGHGPLRVALATQMIDGTPATRGAAPEVIIEAQAELTGTVPEGARTRISLRRKGKVWRSQIGVEIRDRGVPGDGMELYAEALGPGDVVVAQLHSRTDPLQLTLRPDLAEDRPPQPAPVEKNEARWGKRHRGWIIAGTLILAAAAATVTTVFLLRDQGEDKSDQTTVKPMLTF